MMDNAARTEPDEPDQPEVETEPEDLAAALKLIAELTRDDERYRARARTVDHVAAAQGRRPSRRDRLRNTDFDPFTVLRVRRSGLSASVGG
jgi:hypothetical protein